MQHSVDALAEINPLFRAWRVHDVAKELRDEARRMRESGEDGPFPEPSPSVRDGFMFNACAGSDMFPESATLSAVSAGEKTAPGFCGATLHNSPEADAKAVIRYYTVRKLS